MKKKVWTGSKNWATLLLLPLGLLFSTSGIAQDETVDCACTKRIVSGDVITFLNVSTYSQSNDNYTMLTDCEDAEDCSGTCTWAYNKPHEGWVIENGRCREWPVGGPVEVEGEIERNQIESESGLASEDQLVTFYPNPSNGSITIQSASTNVTTIIYNMAGEEVMRSSDKEINTSQLTPGTYIISMSDGVFLQREQLVIQ